MKTYNQKYYELHKESIKACVKRHRESPDYRKKQQEWNVKWKVSNLEKVRAHKRKSQKKIHETLRVVGYVTTEVRSIVYSKYNNKCAVCETTKNKTVDHIVPISKGGKTVLNNLQLLCRSCNSQKSNK